MSIDSDTSPFVKEKTYFYSNKKKFTFASKNDRSQLINVTATPKEVGPGRYEEPRTFFPEVRRESLPNSDKPLVQGSSIFRSNSPRISPLQLTLAPLPGAYNTKSIADDILSKKKIGKKGKFFTTFPKFYENAKDVIG
jgi:hypothetical protein